MALPIKFVTQYKHIGFFVMPTDPARPCWRCTAIGSVGLETLGTVRWHKSWEQHCFCPAPDTIFSADLLKDIQHFIGQL